MGKGFVRALEILSTKEVKMCRDFAELMWPDSDCWRKVYNVGHGATRGAGMWRAGGSMLGKLHQCGLIELFLPGERIRLTEKGYDYLKENATKYSIRND